MKKLNLTEMINHNDISSTIYNTHCSITVIYRKGGFPQNLVIIQMQTTADENVIIDEVSALPFSLSPSTLCLLCYSPFRQLKRCLHTQVLTKGSNQRGKSPRILL
jgi:hypothetical protein